MKFIGQHIWCWITRFKNNVYFTKPVTHESTVTHERPVTYESTIQITELDTTDDIGNLIPLLWHRDSGLVYQPPDTYKTPGAGSTVTDLGDDTTVIDDTEIAGGITTVTPTGDQTKPTDTAANIIANANMGLNSDGNSFEFIVVNEASATHKITISAGASVTLKGDMDVAAKTSATFRIVRTGSGTVTIYRVT